MAPAHAPGPEGRHHRQGHPTIPRVAGQCARRARLDRQSADGREPGRPSAANHRRQRRRNPRRHDRRPRIDTARQGPFRHNHPRGHAPGALARTQRRPGTAQRAKSFRHRQCSRPFRSLYTGQDTAALPATGDDRPGGHHRYRGARRRACTGPVAVDPTSTANHKGCQSRRARSTGHATQSVPRSVTRPLRIEGLWTDARGRVSVHPGASDYD